MEDFNAVTPYGLDMQWVKNDTFTFLDNSIEIWFSKVCGEGMDLSFYDGIIQIKYTKSGDILETITTDSGQMIFTDNVITFDNNDLSLKVGDYFYQLKLISKVDDTIVGTLLDGKFKVLN